MSLVLLHEFYFSSLLKNLLCLYKQGHFGIQLPSTRRLPTFISLPSTASSVLTSRSFLRRLLPQGCFWRTWASPISFESSYAVSGFSQRSLWGSVILQSVLQLVFKVCVFLLYQLHDFIMSFQSISILPCLFGRKLRHLLCDNLEKLLVFFRTRLERILNSNN